MKEVIEEYPPEYCHLLEAAYGIGMMSEGNSEAIDDMFKDLPVFGKKALDIGFGLGGVAYYLAKEYDMDVTGLEINPWMIKEAKRRAPAEIQEKLNFVLNVDNDSLPFEDHCFDIIYSKGVFCHIENKQGILKECYRVLKPGGILVINDFLSSTKGEWGEDVRRMIGLENLSIYAETIDGYLDVLKESNFRDIKVQNLSEQYSQYNEEIVRRLLDPQNTEKFIQSFSKQLHKEAIEGYDSIVRAMRSGEGLVTQFTAYK